MEFEKKIKTRIAVAVIYILIGITLIIVSNLGIANNEYANPFGTVFLICGLVRIVQYVRLLKNPDAMEKRRISETDERNLLLMTQARSLSFSVYIICAGLAVMACFILNQPQTAQFIAYTICAYVVIYWICYMIVKRKY